MVDSNMESIPFKIAKIPYPIGGIENMEQEDLLLFRDVIVHEHKKLIEALELINARLLEIVEVDKTGVIE